MVFRGTIIREGDRLRLFWTILIGLALATGCLAEDVEKRLAALEQKNQQLAQALDRLKEKDAERGRLRIEGYVDTGFFDPIGNGVGFLRDVNNTQRARFPNSAWLLLGDPWSTAVNSRGEPADTDGSFAIPFDNINSNGRASFLVNEINLDIQGKIGERANVFASVDFLPRTGVGGSLGDLLDADFGYLEWKPWKERDAAIEVGKYRSVFGLEYRVQESPDRIGITPSLIHRYLGGHPIGIKYRQKWQEREDQFTIANVSLQNSSSHIEEFSFGEELDSNNSKHVSGRISHAWKGVKWADFCEVGFSAEGGAMSRQPRDGIDAYQLDLDVQYERKNFQLHAETIRGEQEGLGLGIVPSLDFRGFYVLPSYRVTTQSTAYLRYEQRRAVHIGDVFAYVVDIARVTAGVRFDFTPRWILKAEYLRNLERGPVPDFDNDIATVSQVMTF